MATPKAGKRYTVTDAGRQFLSDQAVALDGVRMRIDVSKRSLRGHDRPAEIHEAIHNLRHALQMHHGRWNPAEILRVRDLLNNTAKAIVDGPAAAQRTRNECCQPPGHPSGHA